MRSFRLALSEALTEAEASAEVSGHGELPDHLARTLAKACDGILPVHSSDTMALWLALDIESGNDPLVMRQASLRQAVDRFLLLYR